jgi:hypothetical protein
MSKRPDRTESFSLDVKRNQQTLINWRWEIGVPSFEVPEQQGAIAIKHVAAKAEIARCASADVGFP